MEASEIAQARSAILQLLQLIDVTRVISVDDEYHSSNLDESQLMEALAELNPAIAASVPYFAGIDFTSDSDVWRAQVRSRLGEVDNADFQLVRDAVRKVLNSSRESDPNARLDALTRQLLPQLFEGVELLQLSQAEWKQRQRNILGQEGGGPKTLVLFDQNFSRESGARQNGASLIEEALRVCRSTDLLCGLLSHEFDEKGEYQAWLQLCEEARLDNGRVVLISKRRLDGGLLGFARSIKLTVLNRHCQELKQRAVNLLGEAQQAARESLEGIDIYTFEEIVFESSLREGVWEPDTLFRLFGIFHRHETRNRAKQDIELSKVADHIRMVSGVSADAPPRPARHSWQVQRLEMFEEGDYLNRYSLPIDLGDIFRTSSGKQYMLLGQPCDLMVRGKDGKRNHTAREAILAEIITQPPRNRAAHGEVPFFDEKNGDTRWVSFKNTHSVRMFLLDLCVYNDRGEAEISLDQACPPSTIPAWKLHFEAVRKEAHRIIDAYQKAAANIIETDLNRKLAAALSQVSTGGLFGKNPSPIKGVIEGGRLRYNLQRVGRLNQPRSGAMLAEYNQFQSRDAFEHDFASPQDDCCEGDTLEDASGSQPPEPPAA